MSVGELDTRPDECRDPLPLTSRPESMSPMSTAPAGHSPLPTSTSSPDLRVLAPEEDPLTSADTLYVIESERSAPGDPNHLHRLAEVRKQQGVSRRNLARRLNIEIETVRQHEEPTTDLPLSVLYAYQNCRRACSIVLASFGS